MNRAEHLQWCKDRALGYLPQDPGQAPASIMSDLGKHDRTQGLVSPVTMALGMVALAEGPKAMKEFIEGFN